MQIRTRPRISVDALLDSVGLRKVNGIGYGTNCKRPTDPQIEKNGFAQIKLCAGKIEDLKVSLKTAEFLENWKDVIRISKLILATHPEDREVICSRGYAYYRVEQFESAHEDYIAAIVMDPAKVYPLKMLAEMALRLGLPQRAMIISQKIIQISPNSIYGHWMKGKAHMKMNQKEKTDDLQKAKRIELSKAEKAELRKAEESLIRTRKLISTIEDELARKTYESRIMCDLGKVYSMLGRYEKSLEHLQIALELDPDSKMAIDTKARTYYNMARDFDIKKDRENAEINYRISGDLFAQYSKGETEKKFIDDAKKRSCQCAYYAKDYDVAFVRANELLKLDPQNQSASTIRNWCKTHKKIHWMQEDLKAENIGPTQN